MGQISKIADQIGTLVTRLVNLHTKMMSDLKGILTPEQKQKFKIMMIEKGHMGMHEECMGMHDGEMGGGM
jgi:Spy/CpxP family protein refolding chaperone